MTRENECGGRATSTVKHYDSPYFDSAKYDLNKSLDGDSSTYWCSQKIDAGRKVWWKYNFAKGVQVRQIQLTTRYNRNYERISIIAGNDCDTEVGTLLVNHASIAEMNKFEIGDNHGVFMCYMIQFHLKKASYVAIYEAIFFQGMPQLPHGMDIRAIRNL